jgi:hypothetical protein
MRIMRLKSTLPPRAAIVSEALGCPRFATAYPGFPVTLHQTGPRVRLSLRKAACSSTTPPTSTGNPRTPDFLLRCTRQDRVCGFRQGKPHAVRQRHQPRQEIRVPGKMMFCFQCFPIRAQPRLIRLGGFAIGVDRSQGPFRGFLPRKTTPRNLYEATVIAKPP